ncbi:MAG TPA: hypothetical protein GXZ62_08225 [Lentisphaerae bacterium]|jgi:hypothetical protein|nr:hypothetical protein [Lentisphaerota bacterium]
MKATLIIFSSAVLFGILLSATSAGETMDGKKPTPSSMEDVVREYERVKGEWEFARRTGMSTAKAGRLRELSSTNTVENRNELIKWFWTLPQAEPSSHPMQPEKTAITRALAAMMPPSDFKTFGLKVLDAEINALREAKKWEQENYYPKDVIFATFEGLVGNTPDSDVIDTLMAYAKDTNVGTTVRARFKAFLTNRQFQQDGITNAEEQAKIIIGRLTPPPRHPIPWNIHKDKEKRIAYAKSEEYAKAMRPCTLWRFSETSVENGANEQVLSKLGMAAVTQLIHVVEGNGHTGEKRDYLIWLATDILLKHLAQDTRLADGEREVLKPLHRLLDTMPDLGAHSWRSLAAGNMVRIYEKLGITEKVEIITDPSVDDPSEWKNFR